MLEMCLPAGLSFPHTQQMTTILKSSISSQRIDALGPKKLTNSGSFIVETARLELSPCPKGHRFTIVKKY
jgi:hypothetical protein